VSWNVVIDACVTNGEYEEALVLFREMQVAMFVPDIFTYQSVIGACTGIGSLSLGMWAHRLMFRSNDKEMLLSDVLVNNSLIDLYSKCGSIILASQVFDKMPARDTASWNVMILGLAMHGLVDKSIDLFTRMTSIEKLKPNAITFIGVLSACNHGGLVVEGKKYFDLMTNHYRIEPRIEHYGCIIDILARAGHIEEALEVVSKMPCKPDAVIWRSLLDACCKTNAGLELSESLAKQALEVKDDATSGVYVMLSRVYASANRWKDVALVRRLMSEEGVKKEPGFSSIELADGTMHQFIAGDTCHPRSEEIYNNLQEIEKRLESVGYRPDSSQAQTVEGVDGVKGDSLRLHSERLAISFGLLNGADPGRPIRILKNLRVCKDCHTMTKLVSQVYQVEIIVRDRIRFHHFKDGFCSCMDYW
jgi:pentatricopeptide repeat protein